MDKATTLQLWESGSAAWNEWANEQLKRRDELETSNWHGEARADFSGHTFSLCADFSGFVFPGEACFKGAHFIERCDFKKAEFHGQVNFYDMHFLGEACFDYAHFLGQVSFSKCKFHGYTSFEDANFNRLLKFYDVSFLHAATFNRAEIESASFLSIKFCSAQFIGTQFRRSAEFNASDVRRGSTRSPACPTTFSLEADFNSARFFQKASFEKAIFRGAYFKGADFDGATSFHSSKFLGKADFRAIKSGRSFDMAGASFDEVPDFIQAHFAEAPRLDNVRIQEEERCPSPRKNGARKQEDADLPARYRALKRLALQGHDHAREQEYFAEELKARRRNGDTHPLSQIPGWFYQILSNFGRSILRPFVYWILLSIMFWVIYVWVHCARAGKTCLTCIAGSGEAWWSALWLSLYKALPFANLGSSEKLNQSYACLYGINVSGGSVSPERFTPIIPDLVDLLSILQVLLSLLLIFLFLLALRNRFRIR